MQDGFMKGLFGIETTGPMLASCRLLQLVYYSA